METAACFDLQLKWGASSCGLGLDTYQFEFVSDFIHEIGAPSLLEDHAF